MKWFRKNRISTYPDFWLAYENSFDEKASSKISETRFVVMDTETSGLDVNKDRILSIGAVNVKNGEIAISKSFEIYLKQEMFNAETAEIHGLIRNENIETLSEEQAIEQFLNQIGNSVLVAHHANFDIQMINHALKRMGLPKLKNKFLDTVNLYRATRIKSKLIEESNSLDAISEAYGLDVSDRHTAAGDSLLTAIIFLKTLSKLNKKKSLSLNELVKV